MPIFEYRCDMCGRTIEIFENTNKYNDINAIQCQNCEDRGKDSLAFKIISRTNFKVNGYNAANGYTKTG